MTFVMNEELELLLERVVATVHAKHGSTAEELATHLRVSTDDMFDHLSELVISSRVGMVDACYYPIGATPGNGDGIAKRGTVAATPRRAAHASPGGAAVTIARRAKPAPTVTYHRRA